ncbi:hypothetical protein SDC9_204496 [bioreactor metagenome]|uniref:CCA-adding enzyme C-terminal domain-containing protein n=1 Tax=bioreactor metagenome TaxID=1076179 RepID=A0A645J8L3_9ZZZZ
MLDEKKFLNEFKYPNAVRKKILAMFEILNETKFDIKAVKRMLSHHPAEVVKTAMDVAFALQKIDKDGRMAEGIVNSGECFHIRQLRINGDDLKRLGLQKAQIKNALCEALALCIEDPGKNERELLLRYFIKQQKTPD